MLSQSDLLLYLTFLLSAYGVLAFKKPVVQTTSGILHGVAHERGGFFPLCIVVTRQLTSVF